MVAFRYLRARRREGFISVIAGFSFLGIMLGVATLIIVMAVMNGFRKDLFSKILGLNGHVVVYKIGAPFANIVQILVDGVRGAFVPAFVVPALVRLEQLHAPDGSLSAGTPAGGTLRAWQRRALTKYLATGPRDFLAVATPGARTRPLQGDTQSTIVPDKDTLKSPDHSKLD